MRSEDGGSDFDRLRRRVLWSMPSGLYVLGSREGDRRNAMTLNLAMQVSVQPKQLAVSVLQTSYTHELMASGRVFSLNLLARTDRAVVRKFVKPVELDTAAKTMNGFGYFDGPSGAPILDIAAAYLDCEVVQAVDVGDHTLFVGRVIDAGMPVEDMEMLRMEDTRMNYGG